MSGIRDMLAEQLHSALGRDDFGAANTEQREEVLAIADTLLGSAALVIVSPVPTEDAVERAAKALWLEDNSTDPAWAEMAWSGMTAPDDWSQDAFELAETARVVLRSQVSAP